MKIGQLSIERSEDGGLSDSDLIDLPYECRLTLTSELNRIVSVFVLGFASSTSIGRPLLSYHTHVFPHTFSIGNHHINVFIPFLCE
jgi:hypothetical protein